jgi:hypothetical protein
LRNLQWRGGDLVLADGKTAGKVQVGYSARSGFFVRQIARDFTGDAGAR